MQYWGMTLRTSNFQGATIRPIVPRHLYCSLINFFRALVQKQVGLQLNYLQLFEIKAAETKRKIRKRKQTKTPFKQFQMFFKKPAWLQKNFHGKVLAIRVFSSEGHYALIVSLRG